MTLALGTQVNLADPDTFAQGPPLDVFAELRRECPVAWHEPTEQVPGFWAVMRYEDVFTVLRSAPRFSSAKGVLLFAVPELEDPEFPRMMIEMDAPKHTRYRRLVSRGFTPRMTKMLQELMERVVRRSVNRALELGSFDFVKVISTDLPATIIAEMLGIPENDYEYVTALTHRIAAMDDPEYGNTGGPATDAQMEMFEYASNLGAQKRREKEEGIESRGIVSELLEEMDGDRLSEMEFDLFVMLLTTAGNETTRTAISQGMRAFIEHPEQWERLRREPHMIDTAANEILRFTTPLYYFRRTATEDVELNGASIRAGDHVVTYLTSANYDESMFDEPRRFDIGREPNDHLTFGSGAHYCLGANLARLEIKTMFQELSRSIERVELTGEPDYLRSSFINGIKRMPVRLC